MAVYEQSWYMIYQGRTAEAGIFGGEKPRRQKGSRKEHKERGEEVEHTAPQEPHDLEEPSVAAPHLGQSAPCMMKR